MANGLVRSSKLRSLLRFDSGSEPGGGCDAAMQFVVQP